MAAVPWGKEQIGGWQSGLVDLKLGLIMIYSSQIFLKEMLALVILTEVAGR